MATYRFAEGTLDLAPSFVDQSVNSFSLPVSESELERQVINITIARDVDSDKPDAVSYANEQLVVMARTLPRYELLGRADIELQGQSTVALEFRWRPEERVVHQRQTYLQTSTHFLVVTLSWAPAQAQLADEHWKALLTSLRLE